ncbi:2OG-Fe(II) oxygenase [Babesia caballi]|uniref:2OG-Fe(II) oxygenase n=1 Tax=Babesia caballi TaxID=5871 RepID=A0AAV4M1E2_BABCB|nr:2OG-Fe(II) oxygenase [Babesia caballi]
MHAVKRLQEGRHPSVELGGVSCAVAYGAEDEERASELDVEHGTLQLWVAARGVERLQLRDALGGEVGQRAAHTSKHFRVDAVAGAPAGCTLRLDRDVQLRGRLGQPLGEDGSVKRVLRGHIGRSWHDTSQLLQYLGASLRPPMRHRGIGGDASYEPRNALEAQGLPSSRSMHPSMCEECGGRGTLP